MVCQRCHPVFSTRLGMQGNGEGWMPVLPKMVPLPCSPCLPLSFCFPSLSSLLSSLLSLFSFFISSYVYLSWALTLWLSLFSIFFWRSFCLSLISGLSVFLSLVPTDGRSSDPMMATTCILDEPGKRGLALTQIQDMEWLRLNLILEDNGSPLHKLQVLSRHLEYSLTNN